ncbi:FAD-dependent monooxygenase [Saccharibacillus qingshengii]|uniref:FAD-dependent monooxygenase n=1 Tax=Saccharibacillus qingshengii TaxID=1763540 RepID=UPI00155816FD|nr:FAD-dependent monooxygenase [Saccharibacillus qingshengii]
MPTSDPEVLICGAGPTGLVLALWLTKQQIRVRIVDKRTEPGITSRALAVQARTLELYRQLDLVEAALKHGYAAPGFNFRANGRRRGHIAFKGRHERLLADRLAELGVAVEYTTELAGFEQDGAGVRAVLRNAEGIEHTCSAKYLAGCDGGAKYIRRYPDRHAPAKARSIPGDIPIAMLPPRREVCQAISRSPCSRQGAKYARRYRDRHTSALSVRSLFRLK